MWISFRCQVLRDFVPLAILLASACEMKKSNSPDASQLGTDAAVREGDGGGHPPDAREPSGDSGANPSCPPAPPSTEAAPRELACSRSVPYELSLSVSLGEHVRLDPEDSALDATGRLHIIATTEYPFPWTTNTNPVHAAVDADVTSLSRTKATNITLQGPAENTWPGTLWLSAYVDEEGAESDSIATIATANDLVTFEPVAVNPCSATSAEIVFDHRLIRWHVTFVNDLPKAWSGNLYVSETGSEGEMRRPKFISPLGPLSSDGSLALDLEGRIDFQHLGLDSFRLVAPLSTAFTFWVDTLPSEAAPTMADVGEPGVLGALSQCWTGNTQEAGNATLSTVRSRDSK